MRVLIASTSNYRLDWYVEQLRIYGMDVSIAMDGLNCVEQLRVIHPDVLLLESVLPWGGADGVLAVRSEEAELRQIPVVLLVSEESSSAAGHLFRHALQGLLLRRPSGKTLASKLLDVTKKAARDDSEALPAR